MVVYITKIHQNGIDEDKDFLTVDRPASEITIGELRKIVGKKLKNIFTSEQFRLITKNDDDEEEILDENDDDTVAEVINEDSEEDDATVYVAIRPPKGTKIKVTSLVKIEDSDEVFIILGKTKRWQDFSLAYNSKTIVDVVKDGWWRTPTKGNFLVMHFLQ